MECDNQGFGAPTEGEIVNLAQYNFEQDMIFGGAFIFKVKWACKLKK